MKTSSSIFRYQGVSIRELRRTAAVTVSCLSLALQTLPTYSADLVSAGRGTAPAPTAAKPGIGSYQFGKLEVRIAPPRGWRELTENGNTRVSFFSPDGRTVITVRLTPDNFPAGTLRNEKVRLLAKQRYPAAAVLMETEWLNAEIKGRMIDFERAQKTSTSAPILYTRTRLAATGVTGGLLEVSFTAPATEFGTYLPACEQLLSSLRIQRPAEPALQPQLSAVTR